MADANPYAAYSDPRLGMDAEGKTNVIGTVPVADQNTAMGNMATITPAMRMKKKKEGENPQNVQDSYDYLESLFDGEELSESFKEKTKTIFEAAIHEKVSLIESHILQAAKELIEEQIDAAANILAEEKQKTTSTLVEQLDGYLDYVISEWMEENKVAVERGLRTEIAENFIIGLKDLFENSFIDVPQEKYNVLDDIYEANEELQENVNKLIKENMTLKNEITAHLCAEAFMRQTNGLADTEIEKLAKLAEGIEFDNVEQYEAKVGLLKESYFNRTSSNTKQQISNMSQSGQVPLNEDMASNLSGNNDPLVENVVSALSLLNKNRPKVERVIPEKSNAARVANLINPNFVKDNNI